MTSRDKFCLSWNDFESNISSSLNKLRDDNEFFDVTLACDDEQFKAHKVIISACSPFFHTILKKNPHKEPLLYLRGVKQAELRGILDFMYHGEVTVYQEDLATFLAVAEELKVKGLTSEQRTEGRQQKSDIYQPVLRPPSRELSPSKPKVVQSPEALVEHSSPFEGGSNTSLALIPEAPQGETQPQTQPQLLLGQEEEDSIVEHSTGLIDFSMSPADLLQYVIPHIFDEEGGRPGYLCSICLQFKHIYKANVRNHVESKHFKGQFVYKCEVCGGHKNSKQDLYACKSEHNRSMKMDCKFNSSFI